MADKTYRASLYAAHLRAALGPVPGDPDYRKPTWLDRLGLFMERLAGY